MPSHLHPRSRMTMSLFTSTLLVSFLVVGTPHILPCPAPRHQYADSSSDDPLNPRPRRRRRKTVPTEEEESALKDSRAERECPVPKPGGLVGRILGFQEQDGERMAQRPIVRIESVRSRRRGLEDTRTTHSENTETAQ